MVLYVPPGVMGEGSQRIYWVPVIANPSAPKLTEFTAAGAMDLSCYLMKDGFGITPSQEKGTSDRICSKQTFATLGKVTLDLAPLKYVVDPQNPLSDSHKAYVTLAPGTNGFIAVRWGKDSELALAVADIWDVIPISLGQQAKLQPEANGQLLVQQELVQRGLAAIDVAMVA